MIVGLFRPYQRTEPTPEEPTPATTGPAHPAKKSAPTPSRREAEAARRERLNPTLTPKEARRKQREAQNALRDARFREAESAPGKVLMRDFVDARKGLAAWSMPLLMGTLALSLVAGSFGTGAVAMVSYFTWLLMGMIALDLFLMWRQFRKLAAERLPDTPLKGLLAYGINRSINLRRLRMPAPRVKPGDQI